MDIKRLNIPKIAKLTTCDYDWFENRPPGVFWRPNPFFVEELSDHLKGKRVLEIFSGNALMAALLSEKGIEVKATSLFRSYDSTNIGFFHDVENIDAISATRKYLNEFDALMLIWPPVCDDALAACSLWNKEIIYIGEESDPDNGKYGGCANDDFFKFLQIDKRFESYKGNMLEIACSGSFGRIPE